MKNQRYEWDIIDSLVAAIFLVTGIFLGYIIGRFLC